MNGLKKFFGKNDIEVFESGKKSAEQAKQKARKPKSSKWKKYLAVGASLAILGFATPLGAEKEGLASDFQGSPLKANTIEMTSNIASGNSSTLLAMNDVSGNQSVQQDIPLTQEQIIELYKYDSEIGKGYKDIRKILNGKDYKGILVDSSMVDAIVKKEFDPYFKKKEKDHDKKIEVCKEKIAKAEKEKKEGKTKAAGDLAFYTKQLENLLKNVPDRETDKKEYTSKTQRNLKEETTSMVLNLAYSEAGQALLQNAINNGWKFSLMNEAKKKEYSGGGHTAAGEKVIYIKSIADREADLTVKEGMGEEDKKRIEENRKPYEKLEEDKIRKTFNDKKDKRTDLQKNIAAAQMWDMAHELRHAWQYEHGIGLDFSKADKNGEKVNLTIPEMAKDKNSYNVKTLINIHRTMEADAEAHAVLVAWEMSDRMTRMPNKKQDLSRAFKLMQASGLRKIMPEKFLEAVNGNKMAIKDNEKSADATLAAVKAWHEVGSKDVEGNAILLKDKYDKQVIERFYFGETKDRENPDKKDIYFEWSFDRKFDADKFAKSLKLAKGNIEYLATADDNDFYYTGLRKKDFVNKGEKDINIFETIDTWFAIRSMIHNDPYQERKTDKSYLEIIYNPEKEVSLQNIIKESDVKSAYASQKKKQNEKHIKKQYNNKVATVLRQRKHGRG